MKIYYSGTTYFLTRCPWKTCSSTTAPRRCGPGAADAAQDAAAPAAAAGRESDAGAAAAGAAPEVAARAALPGDRSSPPSNRHPLSQLVAGFSSSFFRGSSLMPALQYVPRKVDSSPRVFCCICSFRFQMTNVNAWEGKTSEPKSVCTMSSGKKFKASVWNFVIEEIKKKCL
jgi:hypothetical protein